MALQALYELDQSGHALDLVLVGRVRDFITTAIEGGLAPTEQPTAYRLLEHLDPHGLKLPPQAELAARLANGEAAPVPPFGATSYAANGGRHAPSPDHPLDSAYHFLFDLVDQLRYADVLVRGVWASREALDKTVAQIAPEWPVEQMSPVDRNVLRLALWEIAAASAPPKVAISEAVELARLFAGEASRRMVNGALGTFVGHGGHLKLPSASILPPGVAPTENRPAWSTAHDGDETEEPEPEDVVEVAEPEAEAEAEAEAEGAQGEAAGGDG